MQTTNDVSFAHQSFLRGLIGSLYQYPLATDSVSYGKLYITFVLMILVFSEASVVICIFFFLFLFFFTLGVLFAFVTYHRPANVYINLLRQFGDLF